MNLYGLFVVCATVLILCGYFGPKDGGTLEAVGLIWLVYSLYRLYQERKANG